MKSDEKKVFLETYSAAFASLIVKFNEGGYRDEPIPAATQKYYAKIATLAATEAVKSLKLKEVKAAIGSTRRAHKK